MGVKCRVNPIRRSKRRDLGEVLGFVRRRTRWDDSGRIVEVRFLWPDEVQESQNFMAWRGLKFGTDFRKLEDESRRKFLA